MPTMMICLEVFCLMKRSEVLLVMSRQLESKSKRGGEKAAEYHKIAQHLKKSAGHLRHLELAERSEV